MNRREKKRFMKVGSDAGGRRQAVAWGVRHRYPIVTDFARLRGWSTSVPLSVATW